MVYINDHDEVPGLTIKDLMLEKLDYNEVIQGMHFPVKEIATFAEFEDEEAKQALDRRGPEFTVYVAGVTQNEGIEYLVYNEQRHHPEPKAAHDIRKKGLMKGLLKPLKDIFYYETQARKI